MGEDFCASRRECTVSPGRLVPPLKTHREWNQAARCLSSWCRRERERDGRQSETRHCRFQLVAMIPTARRVWREMTPWGSYLADCASDLFITQTLPRPVTRRGTSTGLVPATGTNTSIAHAPTHSLLCHNPMYPLNI